MVVLTSVQVSCSFDYLTRTSANIAYNHCILIFGFLLPVGVIAACYVGIIRSVSRMATEVMHAIEANSDQHSSESLRQKQEKDRRDQEIRLTKVLSSIAMDSALHLILTLFELVMSLRICRTRH